FDTFIRQFFPAEFGGHYYPRTLNYFWIFLSLVIFQRHKNKRTNTQQQQQFASHKTSPSLFSVFTVWKVEDRPGGRRPPSQSLPGWCSIPNIRTASRTFNAWNSV